jgi:hypothetical protein
MPGIFLQRLVLFRLFSCSNAHLIYCFAFGEKIGAKGDADSSRPIGDIVLPFTWGPGGVTDMA